MLHLMGGVLGCYIYPDLGDHVGLFSNYRILALRLFFMSSDSDSDDDYTSGSRCEY